MPFRRTSVDSSQRTGFYSPKRSRVVGSRLVFPTDPDAAAYIAAVESADGQELEFPIKVAYNDFVLGCKSDGTWNAIKASCIMAGARTLAGALTPLVGTAPTRYYFTGTETDANYTSTSLLLKFPGVNGSTTFVDESFIRVSATLSGTGVSVSDAQTKFLPTSGYFSGGTGYILLGTNSALTLGTGDFTIEAWIYKTSAAIQGITAATTYNRAASLRLSSASIILDSQGLSNITFSGSALPLNTWYHVAVTRSSGTCRCFVDGVQYGTSQTYTVNFSGQINAIGRLVADNTASFTGYLSDLRVTKGVARYTSAFTPPGASFGTSTTADYNRTMGLVGDGSTKYLDSNRNNNADPQNSKHLIVYINSATTVSGCYISTTNVNVSGDSYIYMSASSSAHSSKVNQAVPNEPGILGPGLGLYGASRGSSATYNERINGVNNIRNSASSSPLSENLLVYGPPAIRANSRLSFYSIGESLDLALLDSRVTTLMADLALALDADVQAYVSAVEAADGQELELEVQRAYAKFIVGCKADGTWNAIKASCIMAGAWTLAGALTPLVGTAPTNNNFVAGDYSRTTGLVGDGSTKYLDSNRANSADPQNNQHMSVFIGSGNVDGAVIGTGDVVTGATHIYPNPAGSRMIFRNRNSNNNDVAGQAGATGLVGMTRASSTAFTARCSSSNTNFTTTSQTPASGNVFVFARSAANKTPARLSFYSIGESLDLALLDSRVTTLMADIAAAIP